MRTDITSGLDEVCKSESETGIFLTCRRRLLRRPNRIQVEMYWKQTCRAC